MMNTTPYAPDLWEKLLKAGILLAALLLLAGALSIPFWFESLSIKYKFGFDKTLLRTGKILGLAAGTLLLFQLLLGARLKLLDRIFTLPRIWTLHRINGYLIALCALLHPVFILWPEDFTLPPFEPEYWPQAVGLLLLVLIGLQVAASRWRVALPIAFKRWRSAHRYVGLAVIVLLVLHILYVSESFEAGLPRVALLVATGLFMGVYGTARLKAWRVKRKRYVITAVQPENSRVTTIELDAAPVDGFHFLPGQFAFISVRSPHLTSEPHPFTISSAPSRSDRLAFTIKNSGDWTSAVNRLSPGDTLSIEGPYGRFSHLVCPPDQPIIFIAGGIGITPFLSMLRHMQAAGDHRRVRLVWSNRRAEDLICRDELARIAQDLTGLSMVHTFTAEDVAGAHHGRLDLAKLQELTDDMDRTAAVFICGPPGMPAQAARDMRTLGFRRSAIHTERFNL